ncbi:MAG: transaldolase [Gemmataceae bacterium]|nr:transaldolase [Gemmataceae bacterium]
MKMFLDSAKTDEILHALEVWDIDGLTTNPRHVQAAGKPFRKTLEEIARLFEGKNKPVSVEVNPHLTEAPAMVKEGMELSAMSPCFVVKIGISEQGCLAIRELTKQGIRVNATLIHTAAQAWLAARAGAAYVSPFLGWKEAHGESAANLIPEVASLLSTHGYSAQIIAAAIRNACQLADAALAGAHCATAAFSLLQEAHQNPFTAYGEKIFQNAWDATPPS